MVTDRKAVMYGAGNIGRGFIGLLFARSGYEVVFVDIDKMVLDCLNSERQYPVRVVSREGTKEVVVENVRGVDGRDPGAVAREIAQADIMATAVGVKVLPHIAQPIAEGLRERWKTGNTKPLNIIICENKLDANLYLAQLIEKELDEEEMELFRQRTGLVEASIGRMVPVMTDKMKEGNPLRVWVEPYDRLPVDRDAFKGEIPDIQNMIPFSPFEFYIQRKLFMHNMAHATTAYLGFLKGYKYIWEAAGDTAIKVVALRALLESALALHAEHGVEVKGLVDHADDLLYRFGNRLLGDTVARVGKDPVRKLSRRDRIAGAAALCAKHGITPVYIAAGAAAGYMFEPEGDESAESVRKVVMRNGIRKAAREFSSIEDGSFENMLAEFYGMLQDGVSLNKVIDRAETIKNNFKDIV